MKSHDHCAVLNFTMADGRQIVKVKAGTQSVETNRILETNDWDHEVEVYVSPTGQSVRVFIDGTEVPVG